MKIILAIIILIFLCLWTIENKSPESLGYEEAILHEVLPKKEEKKQPETCYIEKNFSPTGSMEINDNGELSWMYSTISCDGYRYFGWQTLDDAKDKKNVWINGKQYFRSCQWSNGIPDEELESEDCIYNFKVGGE